MRIPSGRAEEILNGGGIVAVPTETVFGLAAKLDRPDAIDRIYTLKGRPRSNPLIIHLSDIDAIDAFVSTKPPEFEKMARAFWPGPLTFVLPVKRHVVPENVGAGLPTAAFRVPRSEELRSLIRRTGPLVMPSANLSGKPSATSPEHIEEDFGPDFPVVEGSVPSHGLESTIVAFREAGVIILRLGAISGEKLGTILGYPPLFPEKSESSAPICPGRFFRHYAPRARLYTEKNEEMKKCSHLLGFEERSYPDFTGRKILLGSLADPEGVAKNLYRNLRQLDTENALHAWVDIAFPREGLWITIAERLQRAGEQNHTPE